MYFSPHPQCKAATEPRVACIEQQPEHIAPAVVVLPCRAATIFLQNLSTFVVQPQREDSRYGAAIFVESWVIHHLIIESAVEVF